MCDAAVTPEMIAQAFIGACEDELRAPKPGNVHLFAGGHGMEAQDFIDSARAAAAPLSAADSSVGARILGAIEATWARVGKNTNLGIVLLCAPLAQAALRNGGGGLRERLQRVLLACTDAGYAASFLNQPIEVPRFRSRLRRLTACDTYPQILLRIGRGQTRPHSPRRPLREVLALDWIDRGCGRDGGFTLRPRELLDRLEARANDDRDGDASAG